MLYRITLESRVHAFFAYESDSQLLYNELSYRKEWSNK